MSEISRFFGIVIRIFYRDFARHSAPHLHAEYAEFEASYRLPDGELLAGELPRRQRRMVEAWGRAIRGQAPGRIDPLS